MQNWQASGSVTLIGSMPHQDRGQAVQLILREIPEIPVWPQLPKFRSEQMMIQYLEGLPCVESEGDRLLLRTDSEQFETELYRFYEEYMEVESGEREIENSRFRMGEETGKTFFQFLEAIRRIGTPRKAVKGQVVGPFTLLSGTKDQKQRALLYDERIQEMVVKHLAMKAKWQIHQLKALGCPVIVFLDEPALAGFGSSAFVSVSAEMVHQLLAEVVDAIHQAGAMAGIHVCANTDWSLTFQLPMDIINLDAYNYLEKFLIYREELLGFLGRGGIVAWGMVPTNDPLAIEQETAQSLANRWLEQTSTLLTPEWTLKRLLSQSLFTPSCGCGSLSEAQAEHVVKLTHDLGQVMESYL